MIRKAIFSILSLFLILSGNCQAVEIIPVEDYNKNAFQMTMDVIEEHPEYQMLVISDNHLFKGQDNNKIVACMFTENGSMRIYDAYYGVSYTQTNKDLFYHVFEHGEERQAWEFLLDNVLFIR